MITLEYDSMNGLALPEGAIKPFVDQFIADYQTQDMRLVYSQGLILDYFRLAIVRGELDHNIVQVKYLDDIIEIDEDGRLKSWPMPDYLCDVLAALM